jgi:hypothetical protein
MKPMPNVWQAHGKGMLSPLMRSSGVAMGTTPWFLSSVTRAYFGKSPSEKCERTRGKTNH